MEHFYLITNQLKDEEYKVSKLLNLMEELERVLDLFIENKEYKN